MTSMPAASIQTYRRVYDLEFVPYVWSTDAFMIRSLPLIRRLLEHLHLFTNCCTRVQTLRTTTNCLQKLWSRQREGGTGAMWHPENPRSTAEVGNEFCLAKTGVSPWARSTKTLSQQSLDRLFCPAYCRFENMLALPLLSVCNITSGHPILSSQTMKRFPSPLQPCALAFFGVVCTAIPLFLWLTAVLCVSASRLLFKRGEVPQNHAHPPPLYLYFVFRFFLFEDLQ